MKFVTINIDFSELANLDDLHDYLMKVFGFPEFYGRNIHALIDCLSSIKHPEEGMTSFFLDKDEYLLITTMGLSSADHNVVEYLLHAIEALNNREQIAINENLVYVLPSK